MTPELKDRVHRTKKAMSHDVLFVYDRQMTQRLIVFSFIFSILSCSNSVGDGSNIDGVNVGISIIVSGSIPETGRVLLVDSEGKVFSNVALTEMGLLELGQYSTSDVALEDGFALNFLIDTNENGAVDEGEPVFNADTFYYDNSDDSLSLGDHSFIRVSGTIELPDVLQASTASPYVVADHPRFGGSAWFPVAATTGSFEAYFPQTDENDLIQLSLVMDGNSDFSLDPMTEEHSYLMHQSGFYSNTAFSVQLIELYGKVSFTDDGGTGFFDFASTSQAPVLRVEDQAFWQRTYHPFSFAGEFSVFVPAGHPVELRVYNAKDPISSYEMVEGKLNYPVKLAGSASYVSDFEIFGIGGSSTPVDINRVQVKIVNLRDFPDYDLMVMAGQLPIPQNLYDQGQAVKASFEDAGTLYSIFFRDFDRTTNTDGLLNDGTLGEKTTGYGGFFNVDAFIDLNNDGRLNPGEPDSGAFYYGDSDGDDTPTWDGDWNDSKSPSYISEFLDLSAHVLEIPAAQ